jgi:release factor glutamine methyltransferase
VRIADWLAAARALGVDRLDAQLLLTHLLGQPRSWLLAHDDHVLDAQHQAWLQESLRRRAAGVPLAYLTGEREFCGLRLQVTPDVLVPRPETEGLVEWAQACLATAPSHDVIDLGTGSGAVALALKHRHPAAQLTASDASAAALGVARNNGAGLGLDVTWVQGDWWAPVAGRRFGLAVSNPPYIAGDDAHLAALSHEPRVALTPEGDGLQALRRIVSRAPQHLLPGAWLLLEHGHDQGQAVSELLHHAGFESVQTRRDLAGLDRCTGGRCRG